MQDDLQKELEREIRKEGRRDWAYQHRAGLTIAGLMVAAMAIGATVTYVDMNRQGSDSADVSAQSNGVAATIDGTEIKEEDVSAYILQYRNYAGYQEDGSWATFLDGMSSDAKSMREDAIKALARRVVVSEHAKEVGISVTDEEIDERVEQKAKDAGHSDDIEEYVTKTLMYKDMADYRADAEMELLLDRLLETDTEPIEPTELQMVIHASDSTSSYVGSRTYDAIIPIPNGATASEVGRLKEVADSMHEDATKAKTTEDFLKLADESKGIEVRDRGWSCLDEPTASYLDALADLPAGKASDVFRDPEGWHVIWCAETFTTRPDSVISLSEMPEEIYQALKVDTMNDLRNAEMASYADDLLESHDLKVNDMPDGLPYDVDMSLSSYRKEETGTNIDEVSQSGLDALEETAQSDDSEATQGSESE